MKNLHGVTIILWRLLFVRLDKAKPSGGTGRDFHFMGNMILTKEVSLAKITRPGAAGICPRKRLFRLLEQGRRNPIVLVYGPPGSGKTTLVSSYLDAHKLPCLWYQVDEGDSDIPTFFYYMGIAGRRAALRKRKPLPLLTPEYLQGISTFTMRYFEDLFSRFKVPYILVLDNYHCVPAGSNFHDVISNGLSIIPPGINVIIISRHDLPPALTKLHAAGRMQMLGWDELRLTLTESTEIASRRLKRKLPKEALRHLHNTADGWAAGLILMVENLRREGTAPESFGKFEPEEILNYFGSELFNRTDKEVQDFLLKTAFLPRITVTMAEKLTGHPSAGSILSTLSRNNNFTEVHYSPEPVFQYHQLFREFLMARAKECFPNETLSTLLHQAAVLLEETGRREDAVSLYRDIGDWGAIVELIMKQAASMLTQGRYRPLEAWLDSLPKDLVDNNPWLLYWKGASRFPFDPFITQSYFEQAFEQFKIQNNLPGILLAWSSAVDSIIFAMDDFCVVDRWIQIFPELPENPEESIPPEVWIRVVPSMLAALLFRRPEHPETEEWTRRAASIVQGPGSPLAKAPILFHMVHRLLIIGDYEQLPLAIQNLQRLAQFKHSLPYVLILKTYAEVMCYQTMGDHEKCLKAVSEGLKISENSGIMFMDFNLISHAVSSYQNVGDLGMAQTMLEKMVSSRDCLTLYEKALYHFVQTRQFLLQSDLEAAKTEAELGLKTSMDSGFYIGLAQTYLLAAQVMHRIGKHQEAWDYLHEAFRFAERFKSKMFEYYGLMIEAHFHFEEANEASGLVSLRKALAIGKERGFLNTFVDQPAVTAKLCAKALEEGIEVPYVQDIIRKRGLILEKPPLHLDNWPWPLKIFTLGRFGFLRDGKPVQFSKKTQEKPLSLLRALIALGGREAKEEDIADLLWPEAEGDLAQHSFEMTLHRLRTLGGYPDAFQLRDGRLTMEQRYCWVDVWAFERLLGEADGRRKEGLTEKAAELTQRAIEVYRGPFLAGEREQVLVTSFRERLRSKFLRNVKWLGGYREGINRWKEALECYQRGLEVDELAEELYRRLMLCHLRLGQKAEAMSAYKSCEKILRAALRIEPSPETQALYETLSSPDRRT